MLFFSLKGRNTALSAREVKGYQSQYSTQQTVRLDDINEQTL